jgi:phospholipid/cholesterol/gamma-HCH transport system substrate-binding protein
MIKDDIFLVGESLDLLHGNKQDVYLGIRAYF